MTPAEWYAARAAHWTAVRDTADRAAARLSRLRLATFLTAAAFVWWALRHDGTLRTAGFAAAAVLLAAFTALVVRHARQLDRVERAETGLTLARYGQARLARDWGALPDVSAPGDLDERHPYARDLDLFGHASLTRWLGPPATIEGRQRLLQWLLAPAPPEEIQERQAAVDDLAGRAEWREALAIEGALTAADRGGVDRFLSWAEGSDAIAPRFMQPLAFLLPAATIVLLAAFVSGATETAWFLIPLALGIVLSFAFARRMYAAFDRATLGQRSLQRYAAMLGFASHTTWIAPALERLRGEIRAGGDAPDQVARLARLAGWSELRVGAAIFHFVIQAFTLWDFHIAFAFERWRTRSGRSVRGWLQALGRIDALAVLARVRADQPDWVFPAVDRGSKQLVAASLGHPLIADGRRVDNDAAIGPPGTVLLITGSNMSGKSTLLRAIGLNAVLAQAGAPVCASRFTMPPLDVFTSIRVEDSLELGLSYFMAALARLKQIVDAAERTGRGEWLLFYLLDEVLQGTNSVERALAVRAVIAHLLDAGAIGVMTTHDLTLANDEPMRTAATLAHFTEQVHADGSMSFDYRLRPGLATSTNALRLMQLIGIAPK